MENNKPKIDQVINIPNDASIIITKVEDENKVVCDICGYKNDANKVLCVKCSNYLKDEEEF